MENWTCGVGNWSFFRGALVYTYKYNIFAAVGHCMQTAVLLSGFGLDYLL